MISKNIISKGLTPTNVPFKLVIYRNKQAMISKDILSKGLTPTNVTS
jgi:hypothetical protein